MRNELLIVMAGVLSLVFVLFHLFLGSILRWRDQLPQLDRPNQAAMRLLNMAVAVALAAFGYISIAHSTEVLTTSLGNTLLLFMFAFWAIRGLYGIVLGHLKSGAGIMLTLMILIQAGLYGYPLFTMP